MLRFSDYTPTPSGSGQPKADFDMPVPEDAPEETKEKLDRLQSWLHMGRMLTGSKPDYSYVLADLFDRFAGT